MRPPYHLALSVSTLRMESSVSRLPAAFQRSACRREPLCGATIGRVHRRCEPPRLRSITSCFRELLDAALATPVAKRIAVGLPEGGYCYLLTCCTFCSAVQLFNPRSGKMLGETNDWTQSPNFSVLNFVFVLVMSGGTSEPSTIPVCQVGPDPRRSAFHPPWPAMTRNRKAMRMRSSSRRDYSLRPSGSCSTVRNPSERFCQQAS